MEAKPQKGRIYTAHAARSYGTLGIADTTYEIGFDAARRLLTRVKDLVVLDFGAGAGRSSEFLRHEGARRVFAVDHNSAMIDEGRSKNIPGVEYILSREEIPLPDACVDAAVSLYVFIEFSTRESMLSTCKEVYRLLRAGGQFLIVTVSPLAFGHKFSSFEYSLPRERRSGSPAICLVRTDYGLLELEDTYWTEEDYTQTLAQAGFRMRSLEYPLGSRAAFPRTEESLVPPFLVLDALKE
jgi:ubiquinone/menaquinone biosynthesis C-methylase UbiE